MKQIIAHIDMDCFFAACEEKYDPSLVGKPVAIGALPSSNRGVLCTANYEARKYGLKSALPISKAIKLCPNGTYLKPNFILYKNESSNVMFELKKFATFIEQVSIDEAYLDITAFAKRFPNIEDAAKYIQDHIYNTTKLKCSIGVSESRYVAKIASDFKKPYGITVVNDMKSFLAPLEVTKISGIGKKTFEKLKKLNILTIDNLAKYNTFKLIDNFGTWIIGLQELAKGNDKSKVNEEYGPRKSISKEMTFDTDIFLTNCDNYITELINELDMDKYSFKTVSLKVRFSDFNTISRDISLKIPMTSKEIIKNKIQYLLNSLKCTNEETKVRLLGIKVSNLIFEADQQMTINSFCAEC
ncbi:MAG: DNA polymerase IV [Candidatus Woesearchaeota archaeon]